MARSAFPVVPARVLSVGFMAAVVSGHYGSAATTGQRPLRGSGHYEADEGEASRSVGAHTVRPQNGTGYERNRRSPYLTVCSAIGAVHHATALSPRAHNMRPDEGCGTHRGLIPSAIA